MVSLEVWLYAVGGVLLVSLISLIGIFTLGLKAEKLQRALIYLVSFSAGALMGDAFLHLLPEAVEEFGFTFYTSIYILAGIVSFFTLEKVVQWHHHHHIHSDSDHKHFHHSGKGRSKKIVATMNLIGDSVHNLLDGIIIGVSFLVNIPVGIATTLAVLFHEIPQEIGDFGVLLHGGYSKRKALFMNFITALTSLVGVVGVLLIGSYAESFSAFMIPFAAGGFIYIAGSDLIPELHHDEFNTKKSLLQLLVFVLGIAVMAALLFLE